MKDFDINSLVDIQGILNQRCKEAKGRVNDNSQAFVTKEITGKTAPLEIGIQVLEDYPPKAPLDLAKKEEADLIVMGSCTHGAVGHMIDSTTNKVMHSGKFSVLVIPYH